MISTKLKEKKIYFYLCYTIIFVFFMTIILFFHYSKGKTLVNNVNDGFMQFYRALLYLSNYYKKIVNNIFIKHTFVIPQWDFVLGEGGDIIETFHYYGLGDPINLFSVFFNENNLFIFHDLSIFIRMYIAGFVFSKLCFYENYDNNIVVLTGTILYAYSSYALRVLTNYIYFLNPLIYFPLIILGVEKIIYENKGIFLTISVALASITSVYFFYMIVLFTVIYVAIRLLTINLCIKDIEKNLVKIFIYSLFGFLISGVIFFPAAYSIMNNARLLERTKVSLFYDIGHYWELFRNLIFNNYTGWYNGGYTVLGYFGIISIILNKKHKSLKWMIIISTIIMLFPVFGSLFNGMTYIVDRYEFFLSLLIIYCVVASYEHISNSRRDIIVCFIMLCAYTFISIFRNNEEINTYIMFFSIGTIVLLCLLFINNDKLKTYIYLCAAIFSILFAIVYKYLPNYWNYAETHGTDISRLVNIHNEEPSVFNNVDDNTFYRYSGNSLPSNVSVNGNKSSTGYYWSVGNDKIINFRTLNGFHDKINFYYENYDGDYIFNTLSNVKYYFVKKGEISPFGYELYKKYENYDLYINRNALPLFYGYDKCISIDDYTKTNILERKELITQAVITNNEKEDNYIFKSDVKKISTCLTSEEGIEIKNNKIITTKQNSTIEMSFNSKDVGEYYFVIEDLYTDIEMSISVKNKHNLNKNFIIKTEDSHAYDNRHNFVINLGYYNGIEDVLSINIPTTSNLTYKNFDIYCLPLKKSKEMLEKLNCVIINDLYINENYIKANIETKNNKYLCMSIPNHSGWVAYLDGHEIKLNDYNIMYMGFPINKGNHIIELKYSTPLLKEGAVISSISIILFIVFENIKKRIFLK